MFLRQLFDADTWTFTYLVADPGTGKALIIDPVLGQTERDLKLIGEMGLQLVYALDTHVHADHVTAAGALRERTGCKAIASKLGPESADLRLGDGDTLSLGALTVEVLETPGHTDDSVCYRIEDQVFTGDTLFVRGTGRTDFQHGSASDLFRSITEKLFTLSEDTVVWPGHDYRGHSMTTVGEEKAHNPRLAGKSRDEFVAIMDGLGLPPPKHIHEAVPANRELGLGKAADGGGAGFGECMSADVPAMRISARILDVREPHEFTGELGHIQGADNVPMGEVKQACADWDKAEPLLVVCRSGRRSRQVCEELVAVGFQRVTNLSGGMVEYREQASGQNQETAPAAN